MSEHAAGSFGIASGDEIGCVGYDKVAFKRCVLDVYSDQQKWRRARKNGLEFIKKTYDRSSLMGTWSGIINNAMTRRTSLAKCDPLSCFEGEKADDCPNGKADYAIEYPLVGKAIEEGDWGLAWQHVNKFARKGERFNCCAVICNGGMCASGEATYQAQYPDIKAAIVAGTLDSGWQHFEMMGQNEGRTYNCFESIKLPTLLCQIDVSRIPSNQSPDMDLIPSVRQMIALQRRYCQQHHLVLPTS